MGVASSTDVSWRFLKRYGAYALLWQGILILSGSTYQRGLELGGTAEWAGVLHPVIFGLTAWPVFRRYIRQEKWLTIPNTVLVLTYLTIGMGSVHFVFHFDKLAYSALRQPGEVRNALLITIVGIAFYRLGSQGPWFRSVARRLPKLSRLPAWTTGVRIGVFAAVGLAVASKLYLAATGYLGYVTDPGPGSPGVLSIVGYLSEMGILALSGAYFYWFSGHGLNRGDKAFLIMATSLLAFFGLLSGMKHEFLFLFVSVLIPYTWTAEMNTLNSAKRGRMLLLGTGLGVLALLLFAVNPIYRRGLHEYEGGSSRLQQGAAAAAVVTTELTRSDRGFVSLAEEGGQKLWSRLSIFPFQLAVLDQVPERHSFRGLDRYLYLPGLIAIPRIVWPDKPANTVGRDFQRDYISGRNVFSTTPTVYGWTYMDAGIVGVILIMSFLGWVSGFGEAYFGTFRRSGLAVVPYTAVFIGLAEVEADPLWVLGGIPKLLLIALLVHGLFVVPSILIGRSQRRSDTARGTSLAK